MAKINLAAMSVDELIDLREKIGTMLTQRVDDLKKQLSRLQGNGAERVARVPRGSTRGSSLKGRKVEPKYRDPETGETWAARGIKPKWLVARLKEGKKLEDFAIAARPAVGAKKRATRK